MKLRTLVAFARGAGLWTLRRMLGGAPPYYRVVWLAAAARHGVLAALARGPVPFERLAQELAPDARDRDALAAWLEIGAQLGQLRSGPDGWALRGAFARRLAEPRGDAVAAVMEEMASLHHALLFDTPALLRAGRRWTLADQDGVLIARSSRALEPLVQEAIDEVIPPRGRVDLLEIGAGSGTHIRHAAERNPDLVALGLELQGEVAELAQRNLAGWGLAARARVEKGNVLEREPRAEFDVATLHNNIYYFPVSERVALLRHVRGFLRPGGRILVTTGCLGGSVGMQVLNLWAAATEGCGRLPDPGEMQRQLAEAGYDAVRARRLFPGEGFWAFSARRP
jgi:SAM-dependent methyltransferase